MEIYINKIKIRINLKIETIEEAIIMTNTRLDTLEETYKMKQ